jgi:hypothetical protein
LHLLYNLAITDDGSYAFTSDQRQLYQIYFLEYILPDADGNNHTVYNFGFTRDSNHSNEKFSGKFDEKIQNTIISSVNDFFEKKEGSALLYFCFGDDGFGRHRSITFNKWSKKLSASIESYPKKIKAVKTTFYASCLVINDNPLKKLILDAFEINMNELAEFNQ